MSGTVIVFEDHTAQQFRPLAWSVPVHEMPCGMFNLRERLELATRDTGHGLGFLPRGLLNDLHEQTPGLAICCGPRQCLALIDNADSVLFLSSRVKGRYAELDKLLAEEAPLVARDQDGLLAYRCTSDQAAGFIKNWQAWDSSASETGSWTGFTARVADLVPDVQAESTADLSAWRYLWERIHDIAPFITQDVERFVGAGLTTERRIFGVLPEGDPKVWQTAGGYRPLDPAAFCDARFVGYENIWVGEDVRIDPTAVIDAGEGPVVIDAGAHIMPHTYLQGPLYIGAQVIVKAGAVIYGETAVGPMCRVAGEIAESQLLAFMNKQHAGFLGHAVIGSWVNLGADTTCSDLKNNYGTLKVNFGQGPVQTEEMFIGLMLAEHVKSAIGTTFNTATTVGFSSNVFASGFPRAVIPNYAWGDGRQKVYAVERAVEVARIVMNRRGARFTTAHQALFEALAVKKS
jgi:UDP-N-acetylglucosamine diphosphorylase/glucosamine-1-phosphate N-acetyltransferase